jgi:hypothetical protein
LGKAVVSALIVALLLTGCSRPAPPAIGPPPSGQEAGPGEVTAAPSRTPDDQAAIGDQAPVELKELPIPEGFSVTSSVSRSSGGSQIVIAAWRGPGSLLAVTDFYKHSMAERGWAESYFFVDTHSGGRLAYRNGETGVLITVVESAGDVEIRVLWGTAGKHPVARHGAPRLVHSS